MSKKSFVLHIDSLGILDSLTNEQAGELFKKIYEYHNPNKPKETEITQLVNLVFYPFKAQFDRDFKTYENVVERNKNNGSKGGRPKLKNPNKPKKADSDSGSDNDSGNDNKSESKKKKDSNKTISEPSSVSFHSEFKKVFLDFYLDKTKSEYYWQAIDGAKVKSLTTKLLFKIKEKNPAIKKESEEGEILKAFKYLLANITDTWILSNLSMSIVDSKFNEIINKILNPSSNGNSKQQSAINANEQLRQKFRADLADKII